MPESTNPDINSLNFVQRILFPDDNLSIDNGDGTQSTHKMWSSDKMVFPQIIQQEDGSLKDLGTAEAAREYAIRTGEYISFPTDAEAQAFAAPDNKGGYKDSFGAGDAGLTFTSQTPQTKPYNSQLQRLLP
jgi:hypothetical protein